MTTAAIWLITLALFASGFLGLLVPMLPGIGLIWAGIIFFAWATNFTLVSGPAVIVLTIGAAAAWLAEYVSSGVAAKAGGGSRKAAWGSMVGAIVGVVVGSIPGLFIGAFAGALLGALAEGKNMGAASRIATYSMAGIIGGKLVQFLLAIGLVIAFFVAALW